MSESLNVGKDKLKINNSELKILKIDKASIFNSKMEIKDEIETSIFKEQYIKAAKAIIDIINTPKFFNEVNNIITFIGEKGAGKTTILRNFINSLKDKEYRYLNDKQDIEKEDFEVLNIIDLNYKDENNSILSIILYNIYKSFLKRMNNFNHTLRKELEDIFSKLFKQLDEDDLDCTNIFEMNNSFIIKENICELIRIYLNCSKKDYLIIPIDNFSGLKDIEKVICDLRKYFNCKNVIILAALDKDIIDDRMLNIDGIGTYSSRIYIEPIDLLSVKLDIDYKNFNNIPISRGNNIFQKIKEILIKKFNYCIYTLDTFKVLIGTNVKNIVDLISFINSIDGQAKDNEYVILKYLERLVTKIPLGGKHVVILKEILKIDISELNKYLFIKLSNLIIQKKRKGNLSEEIDDVYTYIVSNMFKIKKEKVSIGDIITCIEVLKMYKTSEVDIHFIELLKCLYTVRLILEYDKDSEEVIKIIGKDYFGDYFKFIFNIDKFNNLIEVGGKKSAEDLKHFFGYRKELFISILQPSYDYNNYYSTFLYDEVNLFNEEDIYNQKYYNFKFLNILSYSLMNEHKQERWHPILMHIINIDYWINALEALGRNLKSKKIAEDKYFFETVRYLKEILEENNLFIDLKIQESEDEISPKGINGDFIINEDDVKFLQQLNDELIKAQYLYSYNV